MYTNPVIPGFYPDPSVCRVGEDFYLVTSSFQYFPGVPIFHSRDLIHWRQIGHCLTRESQLPLAGADGGTGIYAPTIRHRAGRFYMVTTNAGRGGNFFVTADNPAGPWSEPVWVSQGGIDPSLFWDDDGTAYFTSNTLPGQPYGIYQAEIDPASGRILTESRCVWGGSGGAFPEAPHLYQIDGRYFLLAAEGGTEYGHMVTVARSESPWGPFEGCPRNPILSHRDRGGHPVQATGHGDLVQAADGSWWMVFLAVRASAGYPPVHHLGRETFLAPVTWDGAGWPVVGNQGTVELEMAGPALAPHVWLPLPRRDDFDGTALGLQWNFLQNPLPENWSLTANPGTLTLRCASATLDSPDSPAFVGRRQQHFCCTAATSLDFQPQTPNEEAGLTVYMNSRHHDEIYVSGQSEAAHRQIAVRRRIGNLAAVVALESIPDGPVILSIEADAEHYHYRCGMEAESLRTLATGETRYLSKEVAGGYTGVYFGLYATSQGQPSERRAHFDWFDYDFEK